MYVFSFLILGKFILSQKNTRMQVIAIGQGIGSRQKKSQKNKCNKYELADMFVSEISNEIAYAS